MIIIYYNLKMKSEQNRLGIALRISSILYLYMLYFYK